MNKQSVLRGCDFWHARVMTLKHETVRCDDAMQVLQRRHAKRFSVGRARLSKPTNDVLFEFGGYAVRGERIGWPWLRIESGTSGGIALAGLRSPAAMAPPAAMVAVDVSILRRLIVTSALLGSRLSGLSGVVQSIR